VGPLPDLTAGSAARPADSTRIRFRLRARSVARRVGRRLLLAEYWCAHGDLDEANRHADRALSLLARGATVPGQLAARTAVTAAEIARDRAQYAIAHDRLVWAVDLLDTLPATDARERLLVRALIGLGDSHRRAARYPQALLTLQRAAELARADAAPDPGLLAATLTVLGITCKEMGAFARAAGLYEQVKQIHDRSGPTLTEAANLHHNLAGLAHARNQYPQAETHARHAVALRRQAPDATQVDVASDLAVLGAALAEQDKHQEALAELTRALDICRSARPPRDYEVAVQLHNLAAVHQSCGRQRRAEELYLEARAIKERLLGPHHPEVAIICNNLGTLLLQQQREAEADEQFRRAISIAQRAYAAGHPVTASIRHNLDRPSSSDEVHA
jgi:tetratricopeptide (TPR) repeat protein